MVTELSGQRTFILLRCLKMLGLRLMFVLQLRMLATKLLQDAGDRLDLGFQFVFFL